MKIHKIFFLLFFVFAFAFVSHGDMQSPTSVTEPADILDPKQKKRDRKIMRNILFVYGQIRQTAEGTLEILDCVSDFALKSFTVLKKVQQVVETSQKVWNTIESYKDIKYENLLNPFKAFSTIDQIVGKTHKELYEGGTDLLLYQSGKMAGMLADVEISRRNIVLASAATFETARSIGLAGNDEAKADWHLEKKEWERKQKANLSAQTQDISQKLYLFKYAMNQAIELNNPELFEKYGYHPKVRMKQAVSSVAKNENASASIRKEVAKNQLIMAKYAIAQAGGDLGNDDSETAISAQAVAEVLSSQNLLFSSLGENESINSLTKVLSAMALSRVENYAMNDYNSKVIMVNAAENNSESIRKWYENHKKKN